MTDVLSLKVADETGERVDAIVAAIQRSAPDATVRRADAMRAILDAGLPLVEARYGLIEKGTKLGTKPAKKTSKK